MSLMQEESSDASQSTGDYSMPNSMNNNNNSNSSKGSSKRTMRMRSLQGQNLGNGKKKGASGKGKSFKAHGFDGHIAPFLEKTYDLITNCDENIASWWDDGESFVVKDPDLFALEWIPKYFDHNKFQSFSRQLNFYGFKKLPNKAIRVADNDPDMAKTVRFYNEFFKRGRHDLLHNIKRSTRGGKDGEENSEIQELKEKVQYLESELSELHNVVKIMQKQMMTMGGLSTTMAPSIPPPPPQAQAHEKTSSFSYNGIHEKQMKPAYLPPPPVQVAKGGERMTSFLRGFSSEFQASGFVDMMNEPVLSSPMQSNRPSPQERDHNYQSNIQRMQSLGITEDEVLNYRFKGEETLDNIDPIKIEDYSTGRKAL
jgi:hypothetical protein